MADREEHGALRYSAFISYSHRDAVFARRLHRMLETYRLPRRLHAGGHRRLRPVFRDRDELAAAADLAGVVQEAIAQSSYLIVVCSANAASSPWVAREVALFRGLHGSRSILVALAEGCSPDLIAHVLHSEIGDEAQPLAADFRREGDGARLALLKLVAVLAGVRLDELVQRDARRHVRAITFVSLAALAGMTVMTVMAVVAVNARHMAERERAGSEGLIDRMLTDLRTGLKQAGRLDLLDRVNQAMVAYFAAEDLSRMDDTQLRERIKLLHDMGSDDTTRGKMEQARVWFEQAARATAARLQAAPDDLELVFDHSQSEYWVGFIDWRTGDSAGAEQHFRAYALLVGKLVRAQPDNTRWLIERGYADSNLGMFLMRHALDLTRAEPLFTSSLTAIQHAASRGPYDAELQVQIADGYGWLCNVERLRHHYDKARAYNVEERKLLDALLVRDARNAEARATVAFNDLALARIDAERHAYGDALRELSEGREIAAALVRDSPDDMYMREQVRAFDLFRVRTELAQGVGPGRPDAVLAELDDCRPEREIFKSCELKTFCGILHARGLAETGDAAAAKSALASVRAGLCSSSDVLTGRWGLNLTEEMGPVLDRLVNEEVSK